MCEAQQPGLKAREENIVNGIDEEAISAILKGTPEISLVALRSKLAEEGVSVDIGMLWQYFDDRRALRRKYDTRD